MKEKVKAIVYGICFLVGLPLMVGAEGGIVAETLTEGTGYLLMFIGLGLIVVPVLIEKVTARREEDEYEVYTVVDAAKGSVVPMRGQADRRGSQCQGDVRSEKQDRYYAG